MKAEDYALQLDLDILRLSRLESVELRKDPEETSLISTKLKIDLPTLSELFF